MGQVRKVNLSDLTPGPVGEPLSADLQRRADALWPKVGQLMYSDQQQWTDGFRRDFPEYREREVRLWESIATAIDRYAADNPSCNRKKILGILVGISSGAECPKPKDKPQWDRLTLLLQQEQRGGSLPDHN
jgi:hypothetical protein